jgi:hypothetical protein
MPPRHGYYEQRSPVSKSRIPGSARNERLQYPLENPNEYGARIRFSVIPNESVSITSKTVEGLKSVVGAGESARKYITETATTEEAEGRGNFREPSTDNSGSTYLGSRKVSRKIFASAKEWIAQQKAFYGSVGEIPAFDDTNLKTTDRVSLYLPRAIAIQDGVEFDTGFQLGTIGGVAEQALSSGASVLGAITGSVVGSALAEIDAFRSGSNMSSGVADILAQKRIAKMGANGESVAGGMQAASKVTTNPNTRAMFKDVRMRNFSFAFSLIPTSFDEAEEIENIIKLFRTELYPTTLAAGQIRVGYKFPNRFKIDIVSTDPGDTNSSQKPVKLKFLPVYMTAFNATYNANSPLMMPGVKFNQADITMSFTETRALTKSDVRDGGY